MTFNRTVNPKGKKKGWQKSKMISREIEMANLISNQTSLREQREQSEG